MRGIQFIIAVGLISELGDLTRFEHPRQLMSWFGITPSEYSSGGSRHQGSITKAGNSYARKLLVEAAWGYRHPARISPAIQKRQENLPRPVTSLTEHGMLNSGFVRGIENFRPKERMSILQLLLLHVSWRVLSGIWAE